MVVEAFVVLLDYSLLESIQGADVHQIIEISLSDLLLASSLATEDSILGTAACGACAPDGGSNEPTISRSLWRLSAKVLGKLGEQFENSSQDPVAGGWTFYRTLSTHPLETLDGLVVCWRSVNC